MYVLRKARVVLHGHLDRNAVLLGVDVDRRLGQRFAARIEESDEFLQPLGREILVVQRLALVVLGPQIGDVQMHALIEVGQFAESRSQRVIVVFGHREDRTVGLERDDRPVILLGRLAQHLHRSQRHPLAEPLAEDPALTVHLGFEQRGKGVHARDAHTVQTAGDLVAVLVELSPGMEHREHDFERRPAFLFMEIGRNAPSVVADGDRVVLVDDDVYIGAIPGERFVDGVVDDLVDEMVQPAHADVADVHGRPLAHRFEPFEHLNAGRRILFRVLYLIFFLCTHTLRLKRSLSRRTT